MTFQDCLRAGDAHINRAREASSRNDLHGAIDALADSVLAITCALKVASEKGVEG